MKIHKANYKNKIEIKILGLYHRFPTALCDPSAYWKGRSLAVTRNWKNVTCKKCLKKKTLAS